MIKIFCMKNKKGNSTSMKTRFFSSLSLLILLLASCAPAAVTPESSTGQPVAPVAVEPTTTPFTPVDSASAAPDVMVVPTESAAPLPVATSRGDALHATDPSTVNLASGSLQFVEFFRFT
jgi:hypothetical protein